MKRLVVSLSQAGLFSGSTTTLCHILKNLGFSWKKIRGNRKLLMERNDFIAWRAGFTRSILTVPVERIIWLGETCLNSDHFKRPKRNDETTREPKNSNKGFRLIVIHAGGIEGFVPNAKLLFRGKKISSDYHNDISHLKFKQWFIEQLIPNLKPESIIVMDDAPYHCAQREKYPTIVQSKDEIIAWLTSKNIKFDPTMFKMELLEIVKQQKPQRPIFEIDEIAKEHGHTVLRIPPRHSHFNPIEIIWNQIKDHVAQNSKTSKISEATKLTEEKIINILSQDWEIAVEHTMEVIRTQGALDNIVEERVDNITSATSSSSETEESDNTDEEFSDEEMDVEAFPVRDRRTSGALQTQPKIAHLKCDSTIDEANGNMDIGKLCKQELVEHEEVEVKNEEENENETSILYRRLANSLPDNQKITANNSFVYGDSIIDIGKPCKQEPVDWNEEM